jgi:hypothetical protein
MDLNFSPENLERLATVEYWKALNPDMEISDYPFHAASDSGGVAQADEVARCVQQMREEGHFRLGSVLPKERMARMAKVIVNLVEAGYPPAFAYVYDDFWQVFRDLSPVLTPMYGEDYRVVINLWAWHVPPSDAYHGFKPHRDLIGKNTLNLDGTPMFGTVWIPLTDVTTQHACMYVLPTNQDSNVPGKMESFSIPKENVQAIRALPAPAGSIMGWNTYALHWGSKSSKWAEGPRISIATYIKRAEERGLNSVSIRANQHINLERRLAVIGENLAHYDIDTITEAHYPTKLMEFCGVYTKKYMHPTVTKNQAAPVKSTVVKVGRNDACPCGSGKKYKQCHG